MAQDGESFDVAQDPEVLEGQRRTAACDRIATRRSLLQIIETRDSLLPCATSVGASSRLRQNRDQEVATTDPRLKAERFILPSATNDQQHATCHSQQKQFTTKIRWFIHADVLTKSTSVARRSSQVQSNHAGASGPPGPGP